MIFHLLSPVILSPFVPCVLPVILPPQNQNPTVISAQLVSKNCTFIIIHFNIVTCISMDRQRVGKHIPATQVHATIEGHPLLDNGQINTHFRKEKTVFSVGYVPRNYKRTQSEDKGVENSSSEVK
jgi:hypothetical protein